MAPMSLKQSPSSSSVRNPSGLVSMLMAFLMGVVLTYNLAPDYRYTTPGTTTKSSEQHVNEAYSTVPLERKSKEVSATTTSEAAMALWWMSNLRDTPLQMTDDSTVTGLRQLVFPPETTAVWIDVGVNVKSDFIINLDRDKSLFVLGFEPSKLWKPCPHRHCVVFWAACTPDFDVVNLNVQSGGDLCDSVFKPNTQTTTALWKGCVTQETDKVTGKPKVVQVPGIPLHALVERIPEHIQVEYIKIDAQGYDLEVMKGALAAPHGRIQVVSLETMDVEDESQLLYLGQVRFVELKKYLEGEGWIYVKSVSNNGAAGETNAFFVSEAQFTSKVGRLADILMSNKEGQGE